jgi:hypothetical protein
MGQYFTPILLNSTGTIVHALEPADYGSGEKIYGHTRAHSPLLTAVHALLARDGGARLVWAGDYADDEPGHDTNLYYLIGPAHFVRFAGLLNSHHPSTTPNAALPQGITHNSRGFVSNPDKGHYIDTANLPLDDDGVPRHPLPTLTGDGGPGHVGPWARDRLYYTTSHPGHGWTSVNDETHPLAGGHKWSSKATAARSIDNRDVEIPFYIDTTTGTYSQWGHNRHATARHRRERASGIVKLWNSSPTIAPIAGTRWAAYNAVTEYLDHIVPVRGARTASDASAARALRNITTAATSGSLKAQAFRLLQTL